MKARAFITSLAEAQSIFVPSQQTKDHFWPLWKFVVQGEVVFYLDQAGNLYKRLTVPPPGGR